MIGMIILVVKIFFGTSLMLGQQLLTLDELINKGVNVGFFGQFCCTRAFGGSRAGGVYCVGFN